MDVFDAALYRYEELGLFADEINTLVLKLKKHSRKAGRTGNISNHTRKARRETAEYLEGILAELKPDGLEANIVKKRSGLIRPDVRARIARKYERADVKELIGLLNSEDQIDAKGFELLDSLCDIASGAASASLRGLDEILVARIMGQPFAQG